MEKMSDTRLRAAAVGVQTEEALLQEKERVQELAARGRELVLHLKESREALSGDVQSIRYKRKKATTLGKLTDFGKSKHGMLVEKRSERRIAQFAADLMDYAPMEVNALELGYERKKRSIGMNERLQKPRTQFQLLQQSVNVDKATQRVTLVCRQLEQRIKEIDRELAAREKTKAMSDMRAKIVEMVEKAKNS